MIYTGPEPPEPGLPNYPGFEKDVFNVVKDYFTSQDEPLIPFIIYDLITDVFGKIVLYCDKMFEMKKEILHEFLTDIKWMQIFADWKQKNQYQQMKEVISWFVDFELGQIIMLVFFRGLIWCLNSISLTVFHTENAREMSLGHYFIYRNIVE